MYIENGFVRCVAILRSERRFTVGKVYKIVNNTLTSDDGFTYELDIFDMHPLEWLRPWYTFEIVDENGQLICSRCGKAVENHDAFVIDGVTVCKDCLNDMPHCDCCGRALLDDDYQTIDDEIVCDHCVDRYFVACECCGELIRRYNALNSVDGYICDDCADEWYVSCDECGDLVHREVACWDDDNECYYCEPCYEEIRNKVINRYNYKPVPVFYGGYRCDKPLFMGVELEIDGAGEYHDYAKQLLDIVNYDDCHLYAKHDGSLEDGFELVSHPATLEYHLNNIEWRELMKQAVKMGYRSHNTDTCGLHVHVSRDALGNDYDEQENTISKIIYFVENNWREILRFTRRTESQLRHWASRYGICEDIEKTYKKAKGDYNRYRCINLQNDHTIEFRMFRGTLNYNTFVATLQLVNAICTICKNATMADVEWLNWSSFISRINAENNKELFEYLQIRGLLV